MLAICIESSHARGMGHLFRALNLISCLEERKEAYIVLVNGDEASLKILRGKGIPFEKVDFNDESGNWEARIIQKYGVDVWLNDKFESSLALCGHVKEQGILLAAIDDHGPGAKWLDIHFAGMLFDRQPKDIPGKRIYAGLEYNILNPEIALYRRQRRKKRAERMVVTLGGSDTYGVTPQVVDALRSYGCAADVIVGANFRHEEELLAAADGRFHIYREVPSLMELFSHYDLAITGGGVTCLEANGAGLPCIIVANEPHEVDTARYLESKGGAVFAGYYQKLSREKLNPACLSVDQMSLCALKAVTLEGRENVYHKLKENREKYYAKG